MHGAQVVRTLAVAILLLAGMDIAEGQQSRSPTIDDVLAVRSLSDPQLSPDGARIAFVVREVDHEAGGFRTRIHIAPTGAGTARPITRESLEPRAPQWSPSASRLAFLAADDDGRVQLWVLPADGGDAWPLTRREESVRAFEWAPDGGSIIFLAPEPEDPVLDAWAERRAAHKDDARIVHGERRTLALWRVAVEPGARPERLTTGDPGIREFSLSPDGARAVIATNHTGLAEDATDLWVVDLQSGERQRLTDRAGSESSPVFSPDGNTIAFRASLEPGVSYSQPQLFVIDAEGGEPRNLTPDLDRAVRTIQWPARSRTVFFTVADGAYERIAQVDVRSGEIRPVLEEDVVVKDVAISSSGRDVYAVLASATQLEELYAVERRQRLRRLTALNHSLETDIDWARQEVVSWKSIDGLEVEGLLTYPHGYVEGRRYPLILEIHGGPYNRVTDALPGRAFAQLWAARGYLVLQPNFRGSQGYGEVFGRANYADLGGGDFHDLMTGVDTLIERGLADPERMGVTGGSYGGYMTNWIIGQTDRFAAAISLYGIFSLITDFSNSNIPNWEVGYFGAYYWDDLQPYLAHSPMSYVQGMTTPTLILHGEADDNTVVANSAEMYQALRLLEREAEFVLYPREGHGIASEPVHITDKWNRMRRWFDERVLFSGRPEAVVYEVGDSVPALPSTTAEGWTLRVLDLVEAQSYLGEEGEFLELELLWTGDDAASGLEFVLTGEDAGLRLEREGESIRPTGVPAERLGEAVLVSGPDQRVRFPGPAEARRTSRAIALAIAFPRPSAGTWQLRVDGFAPVVLRLGDAQRAVARMPARSKPASNGRLH